MEKRQQTRRKKKNSFLIGITVLVVVLVIAITVTLVLLYKGLERYESTTPRAAIDNYFSQLAAGDYEQIQTDSGFEPDEINGWEEYTAFLLSTFGDHYDGFTYRQIAGNTEDGGQMYAVYEGEERVGELVLTESASAKNGYVVRASIDYLEPYKAIAPGDVTVMVNGEELPKEGEGVTVTANELFAELPEDQVPSTIEYELEGTLAKPEFSAVGPDGVACEVKIDEKARTVTAIKPTDEGSAQAFAQLMEDTIKAYTLFISEDGTFANFSQHLYPGTDFAAKIGTFDAIWFADHDTPSFEAIKTSGITQPSANTFEGEIEYIFQVPFQGEIQSFPSRYRMGYVQQDGRWLLVKFETLNYEDSGADSSAPASSEADAG